MDKEEYKEKVKLRKKMWKESAVSETKENQVFMSSLTSLTSSTLWFPKTIISTTTLSKYIKM